MGRGGRWKLATLATMAAVVLLPAGSAAQGRSVAQTGTVCHSDLNNGNHGHVAPDTSSPCWTGNSGIECNYDFCETFCGHNICNLSKSLVCKVSGELGRKVSEFNPDGTGGYRIEDPHKTVSCHGRATFLAVYLEHDHLKTGVHTFRAVPHTAHSVATTLHFIENIPSGETFLLMVER